MLSPAQMLPKNGSQPQPHLGIGGDTQHSRIIQAVEIVAGLARPAKGLLVGYFLALKAQLRHNSAQKTAWGRSAPQNLDKFGVIEAKAGKLLDLLHVGEFF